MAGLTCRLSTLLSLLVVCQGQTQKFHVEPQDTSVTGGNDVVLNCSVVNLQGLIQWTKNKIALGPGPRFDGYPRYSVVQQPTDDADNVTSRHLLIERAQLEDDARYECQVGATESVPGLRSYVAKLTVQLGAERVSIEGGGRTEAVAGSLVHITCHASPSRPPVNVTWNSSLHEATGSVWTNSTVLADKKRYTVTSILMIRVNRSDNGRVYQCSAINVAMATPVSATTQLTVHYVPVLSLRLTVNDDSQSTVISEYDKVTFICSSVASPPVNTWKWYIDSLEVRGQRTRRFTVARIDRRLNGKTVSCEATNSVGSARRPHVVQMRYGPMFVVEPRDQSADIGNQSATLSCIADSRPKASMVWTLAHSSVERVLSRAETLLISPVSKQNFTSYRCTATVSGFPAVSRIVRLRRNARPVILSPGQQRAEPGVNTTVNCTVLSVSERPVSITWSKLSLPTVHDLNSLPRYTVSESISTADRFTVISVLHITKVQTDDLSSSFNCTAINEFGVTSTVITLLATAGDDDSSLQNILAGVLTASFVIIIAIIVVIITIIRRRRPNPNNNSDHSSDSSDFNIVKTLNSKSPPARAPYKVRFETPEEQDVRTSSSTLQDEELTGSYTVSSSPSQDYNVGVQEFYKRRPITSPDDQTTPTADDDAGRSYSNMPASGEYSDSGVGVIPRDMISHTADRPVSTIRKSLLQTDV